MILIADRRSLAQDIQIARDAGARLVQVCEIAGIDARTLQRWNAHEGLIKGDGRPAALRPTCTCLELGRACQALERG